MIKPQSNAPSDMQPWVRTTDKQIEELEKAIARLQAATNPQNIDHEQNYGINSTFTFVAEDSGQVIPYATGMNFTGNVVADSVVDVGGSLTVGAPNRQELDPETGEPIGAIPNFEMSAGQFAINPVTGEEYYTQGAMHMTDSALNLNVNGIIAGDGLSIALSNSNQVAQTPVLVALATGDGTSATYTIEKTDATIASYVAGKYVTITGMNPTGYNVSNLIILSVDSSGTDLLFVVENTESGTFVSPGGYAVISNSNGAYDGKLSVQGLGPNFAGITINQDGIYAGNDAGNPATATAYVTPTTLKAPEVSGDYLKLNGTKVSVSVTAPTSPANGDLWIDPTGSSALATASTASFGGNLIAQSLRATFASASARDAAIPLPVEGMICYLEDVNHVTAYLGSAWFPIAGQMPKFAVRKIANQTVASSTLATVTFSTSGQTDLNRGGFTLSSHKVAVPISGYYHLKGSIFFDSSNTTGNNKEIRLYAGTSGSEVIVSNNNYYGGLTLDWIGETTAEVFLTAGQVVYLAFYATGTGNHTILNSTGTHTNYGTALMIDYLGP